MKKENKQNKMMKVQLSGKLLRALESRADKKGYAPIYYARLTLAKFLGVAINDRSVQMGGIRQNKK